VDDLAAGSQHQRMNPRARAPRRYALVPEDGIRLPRKPGQVRRYSLARLAPSSRSALGVDRLERLEEVARRGRDSA
jgi:hypothetical protein